MTPRTAKTSDVKEVKKESTPTYQYGTGRRKTAIAQVRIYTGTGILTINDQPIEMDVRLTRMLDLVGLKNTFDISAHVHGGGKESQLTAIGHGLARALLIHNPELRITLKKSGYLTRDPREKERKKYGLHSARRGPQFSKR